MKELFGEFLGTLILILLGNGVVAGVVLPKTKATTQVGSSLLLVGGLQLQWQPLSLAS